MPMVMSPDSISWAIWGSDSADAGELFPTFCLRCGLRFGRQAGGDVPRQQLRDAIDKKVGDAGEYLAQICFRI
jgi:hypothetical protein